MPGQYFIIQRCRVSCFFWIEFLHLWGYFSVLRRTGRRTVSLLTSVSCKVASALTVLHLSQSCSNHTAHLLLFISCLPTPKVLCFLFPSSHKHAAFCRLLSCRSQTERPIKIHFFRKRLNNILWLVHRQMIVATIRVGIIVKVTYSRGNRV